MEYGFGLIGCGNIAPVHAEAIMRLKNARLVAVCDIVEEKARAFGEKYGAEWRTDYHELLARHDLQVVNIVTWSGNHADIGIDAALAGKHVIVTKPIDIALDKIDKLIATCRRQGVKLGATHQFRSYGSFAGLKRAIDEGRLGRIYFGNAFVPWWRGQSYYDSADWRGTWRWDGGGALMNQSVHYVDLIQWLVGPVAQVHAYTETLAHDIETEDAAVAALRFHNGALGLILGSTCVCGGLPSRIEVFGEKGNVIIVGETNVTWGVAGEQKTASGAVSAGSAADPMAGLSGAVEAHMEQIGEVLRAIEDDRDPALSGEQARAAVAVVLAIYESARSGRPAAPG